MTILRILRSVIASIGVLILITMTMGVVPPAWAESPQPCGSLATDPANGVAGNANIKSAGSAIVPAAGPDVAYCGGGAGPSPLDPFGALVSWVEHGIAPETLLAAGGSAAPPSGRTRPLCPYPQTAIYSGTGDINNATSFHCGGNLEAHNTVCRRRACAVQERGGREPGF
jgi:tannase/feruloyl esterase